MTGKWPDDWALTRGELERIRGKDLRPVLPPGRAGRIDPPKGHGTRGRYQNGCRCDWCKAANRDYIRERRAKGLEKHWREARRERGEQ